MSVKTYQKSLEKHLAEYRVLRLGVRDTGTFTYKGTARHYGHILPAELKWLNVLEAFRKEIRAHVDASSGAIKLHRYFHHLNSSQALALSLFYPYLNRGRDQLGTALGRVTTGKWAFEAVPDKREGTNVDVLWESADSAVTYCEVKLSEREFGTARNDDKHQWKLARIYTSVLHGQVDPIALEPDHFFGAYQILRNIWLAARKGHERDEVVFLLPKGNAGLVAQLKTVLSWVMEPLRSRVRVVYVEQLLKQLAADVSTDGLAWYARQLQEKYELRSKSVE